MMNAYDEVYIETARETLANMLHFAVYDLSLNISEFYNDFINCGLAKRFGKGEPKVTVGMSGSELAREVIRKTTGELCKAGPAACFDRTPEYWCGWALAYYQWCRSIPFEHIENVVPIETIIDMYNPLHEADITKFISVMDDRLETERKQNQLSRLRTYAGLTQKMLADSSGISVRMIEQYEQGRKDLRHASAETVYRLSNVLGCDMIDLMY